MTQRSPSTPEAVADDISTMAAFHGGFAAGVNISLDWSAISERVDEYLSANITLPIHHAVAKELEDKYAVEWVVDRYPALVAKIESSQFEAGTLGQFLFDRIERMKKVFINCPGCDVVVDPTRPVCPGCGRCVGCGTKRAQHRVTCPACYSPYCACCGICAKCFGVRYSDLLAPCDCGHPSEKSIHELVTSSSVKPLSEQSPENKPWWQFW